MHARSASHGAARLIVGERRLFRGNDGGGIHAAEWRAFAARTARLGRDTDHNRSNLITPENF